MLPNSGCPEWLSEMVWQLSAEILSNLHRTVLQSPLLQMGSGETEELPPPRQSALCPPSPIPLPCCGHQVLMNFSRSIEKGPALP